ncbi:Cytochrome P450 3A11, partial [Fragariocoptes setiger]
MQSTDQNVALAMTSVNALSMSLVAILGATLLFIYYRYKHSYWSKRGIPGPKPSIIVGNVIDELIHNKPLIMRQWVQKYGRVFGMYNGVRPVLVVADANILKDIMVKDAHVFPNHRNVEFLHKNSQNMLFFMRDARWKSLRSLLAFTMTSGKIKRLFHLMMEAGDELLAVVGDRAKKANEGGDNTLDTKTVYGCYTLDVIARASFAMRFDSKESEHKHRQSLVAFFMKHLGKIEYLKMITVLLVPKAILRAVEFQLSDTYMEDRIESIVQHIIDTRRKLGPDGRRDDMLQLLLDLDASKGIGEHMLETTTGDESESHHVASADKEEIKDVLEKNGKIAAVAENYGPNAGTNTESKLKLTDREIIGNCRLFLIAGYETTSSLLSFATHTLAHHPEAQEKLFDEIRSNLPHGVFDYEKVTALPFLDAVISETLRLFPPVTHMDREAVEDYRIESLNLTIPKDGVIGIPFYTIHRDERYYEQPDSFIPERFLPENRHKLTPYTYLPFGAGIRHCLGMRFALAEAKLALARLVFNFKFTPAPGQDFPPKLERSQGLLKSDGLKSASCLSTMNTVSVALAAIVGVTAMIIYWARRGIPGPKPLMIVGNFLDELLQNRPLVMQRWCKQYGRVFGTYNGIKPALIVADADILKSILVKDAHIFPNHVHVDFVGETTDNMLFFLKDARWKSLRSLLAFTMTSGKIKRIFPLMIESGDELIALVGDQAKKKENNLLDVKKVYGCYTLDIITRASFAMRFDTKESEQKHRSDLVAFLIAHVGKISWLRIAAALLMPKALLKAIDFNMFGTAIDDRLGSIVQHIIDNRRKMGPDGRRDDMLQLLLDLDASNGIGEHMLETTMGDESESHHVACSDKEEIKTVLEKNTTTPLATVAPNYGPNNELERRLKLTDREITSNSQLFLIAGYETTSSLMSFATFTLAHHPEAQERLYEELKLHLPDGVFDYEKVTTIPYLDAVISETLRLFPPFIHIDREANEEYRIESLRLTIPKYTAVQIPVYAIHHDEQYYEQPDSFIPERFLPENRHKLTPYTYLPFGAGIRHCLGMRFALAVAKLALARLVFNFKFSPEPGYDFPPTIKRTMLMLNSDQLQSATWMLSTSNTMSVILAAIILGATFMTIYYRHKYSFWSKRGIPGPRPYPVVGNLLIVVMHRQPSEMQQWIKQYGRVFGAYNGGKPVLIVAEAEVIKNVMVKDAHVFPNHEHIDFMGKNFGNMLFFMRDARWKSLRSLLAFTMTSGKIKRLFPLMMESGDELIASVGDQAKEEDNLMNPKSVYGSYTLDVIARAAFAMRFDNKESENKHRRELVKFLMKNSGKISWVRVASVLALPKTFLKAIDFRLVDSAVDERLESIVQHIIDTRRKLGPDGRRDDMLQLLLDLDASKGIGEHMLETTTGDESESHHVASADKEEIKDVLEKNGKIAAVAENYGPNAGTEHNKLKLTDDEIIGNCQLFIIAGYETTSSLLSFSTHTLAHHPEAQEKLYEEIKSTFPNGVFDYEKVSTLTYLDAVISENLRMFSPARHVDRQPNDDYRIESLNLTIPKDMPVIIPIHNIHYDEQYYEKPYSFLPERFLPENRHKLTPYTYLPFGAGIRHCLGMRFALAEAKLALARLVFNFKFSPAPGHDFPPKIEHMAHAKWDGLTVKVNMRI